jgi:hypothetical protein
MFSRIMLCLVILFVTWELMPVPPAHGAMVLSNLDSVGTTGSIIDDRREALRVWFRVPEGDLGYHFPSVTVRLRCLNVSDDCRAMVSIGSDTIGTLHQGVTVPAQTTQTYTVSNGIRVDPNTTGHIDIKLRDEEDTLEWLYASNAPTGILPYLYSGICLPSCVPITEHFAFELYGNTAHFPTPTLITPAHRTHTTNTTPTFTWWDSGYSTVQTARLVIYTEDRSFEFKQVVTGGIEAYTLNSSQALIPGKYLWRVRYRHDPSFYWGDFSSRNTLFID